MDLLWLQRAGLDDFWGERLGWSVAGHWELPSPVPKGEGPATLS